MERYTSPYFDEEEIPGDILDAEFPVSMRRTSNNYRIAATFDNGYWSQIRENIDDFRTQMFPKNMTGGVLDRYARTFGMLRKQDESDASFRIRVQGEIKKRIGGPEPDAILQFVESFLDADPGDVTIIENKDTNDQFQNAFFRIIFSTELLGDLGFESPFTDEIDQIEQIIDRVAGAGVQTKVTLLTADEWDNTNWDEGIYGS